MADDNTGTDDTTEDTEEEYEAPDQESWTKTTEALTKANNEAKKWRLRAQGKDEKWAVPGWSKAQAEEDDDDDTSTKKPATKRQPKIDADAIRREAEEAALAKAKPGLVRSTAKDVLRDAGLLLPEKGDGSSAYARAFRLLDLESIDVDEDGTVSGVEDQVKQVKRDYPELFAKRGGTRVNAGAGSSSDGGGKPTSGSADKLAAMLLGKG